MTVPSASKAASHSRPGSRSPAFASSMIFWATASRVGLTTLSACWRATRAISKAKPKRRAVSGSNPWPCRCCLIGMGAMLIQP